jgi:hypothetical protein
LHIGIEKIKVASSTVNLHIVEVKSAKLSIAIPGVRPWLSTVEQ